MIVNRLLRAADPALGATADGNGADQIDPKVALANLLTQQASANDPEPEDAAPANEQIASEETSATEDESPDQEISPSEEGSQDAPEEPEAEATETETQDDPFAGLSPKQRTAALELVKRLQPGEIPRIAQLVAAKHQLESTIEEQAKRIEELESNGGNAPASEPGQPELAEDVVKLKTVQEVQRRTQSVQNELEAVQDFLDANPGDAETEYQIGGKTMTRKSLIELRSTLRTQARQLTTRGQQIVDQQQFSAAKQRAEAQLVREFPVLGDDQSPVTKQVRELMRLPEFANRPNGLELAYIMAKGNEVVTAERAKAKQPSAPLVKKPTGTVPAKKPLANGSSAPRGAGTVTAKAALESHGKTGSVTSFAAMLGATNAGQKRW